MAGRTTSQPGIPGMLLTAVSGLGIAGHSLSRAGSFVVLLQADSYTAELQKICRSGSRHCLCVCVWFSLLRDKKWCGRRTGAQQGKPERFKSHGQESARGRCGGAGHSGQTVLAADKRQDQQHAQQGVKSSYQLRGVMPSDHPPGEYLGRKGAAEPGTTGSGQYPRQRWRAADHGWKAGKALNR